MLLLNTHVLKLSFLQAVHIFHKYLANFYNKKLKVCVLGMMDPNRIMPCRTLGNFLF